MFLYISIVPSFILFKIFFLTISFVLPEIGTITCSSLSSSPKLRYICFSIIPFFKSFSNLSSTTSIFLMFFSITFNNSYLSVLSILCDIYIYINKVKKLIIYLNKLKITYIYFYNSSLNLICPHLILNYIRELIKKSN